MLYWERPAKKRRWKKLTSRLSPMEKSNCALENWVVIPFIILIAAAVKHLIHNWREKKELSIMVKSKLLETTPSSPRLVKGSIIFTRNEKSFIFLLIAAFIKLIAKRFLSAMFQMIKWSLWSIVASNFFFFSSSSSSSFLPWRQNDGRWWSSFGCKTCIWFNFQFTFSPNCTKIICMSHN